jgi:penicillin-binding protein 1B
MFMKQLISASDLTAALQSPIETVGFDVYRKQAPYFVDYLSDQLTELYPPEALTAFGLSIYTTLDTQVQHAAEAALRKGLRRLEKDYPALRRDDEKQRLQGAIVVIQPKTGHILAMVGGRDYALSQFNRVTQARRQPGSAFKPFVFLSALDSLTPASLLHNTPVTYTVDGKTWEPHNFEPMHEALVTLRRALQDSINLATVDCAMQVGLNTVLATANKFEFSTPLKPYPSLALGAFETIPLELARSYCAFAADGVLPYPLSLQDVLDEDDQVLEGRHTTIKRVTSPAKAFIISSLLRGVVEEGTGRSLKEWGVTIPVAAKTGTTNNYRDAWFVGYTPDILVLVWVGFDNGDSLSLTGAQAALPIWADLVKSIPGHISGTWFRKPPGVVECLLCKETGLLAVEGACPETTTEFFLAGHAPTQSCGLHEPKNTFKKILQNLKDVFSNH